MTTQEFITKLKQNAPVFSMPNGISLDKFSPLFSIVGAIIQTKELIDGGFEASASDLILPHMMLTFGPPLIANSLYPRFKVTNKDLVAYLIGFVLSLVVSTNQFAMYFINEVPYLARFLSLVKLKNTEENITLAIYWIVTSKIVGMCLNRMVFKKKLKVKAKDIFSLVVTYGGVFVLRKYGFNDYYVMIIACIVPLAFKAVEYLNESDILTTKKVKRTAKSDVKQDKTEVKTPRKTTRKASLSAKIEKSK